LLVVPSRVYMWSINPIFNPNPVCSHIPRDCVCDLPTQCIYVRHIIPKMDPGEIGWCGMDWIDLAQDRGHGNKPLGSVKCLEILE
jgi:hypothetical protein